MSKRPSAKPSSIKRQCSFSSAASRSSANSFSPVRSSEDPERRICASSEHRVCAPDQNCLNSNTPSPVFGRTFTNILLAFSSSHKSGESNPCQKKKPAKAQASHPKKFTLRDESRDDLNDSNKCLLCSYVFKDIIGCDFIYRGPFGRNIVTYLDYVASGRPLKCIEQYIRQYVMPTYSNTHTEVNYIAEQTTRFREEARDIIRESVNATEDDAVIFTGSGATAAINKLIVAMNLTPSTKDSPIVFVGPYEHHSNILPWREIAAKVITIRQLENGLIDMENLKMQLEVHTKCSCSSRHLLIGSFSAASNVTGILTDVDSLATLMHCYGGFAFFDYACAAPYTDIDMNPCDASAYKDAIFISPHKFIGGPQTPGILVAKKWLFQNQVPHGAGGGTVVFVRRTAHTYSSNVEHREEGGTPGIIESIRAGLVFKLKMSFTPQFIMARERQMFKQAKEAWSRLPNLLILGNMNVERLPIFPLLFLNPETGRFVHHDFVAKMLNDVFGIQVRSGCACAGPYGMDLLGVKEKTGEILEKLITVKPDGEPPLGMKTRNVIFKPGYVRLNFPYFMPEDCVNFVLKAIEMTSEKGWVLLPLYNYNRETSQWWNKVSKDIHLNRSLHDVTFKTGQFSIKKSAQSPLTSVNAEKETWASKSALTCVSEADTYDKILERAEKIFAQAATPELFDIPDTSMDFTREEDALRWFMLPSEAADIINHRQVNQLSPEDLPFLPTAMKDKLGGDLTAMKDKVCTSCWR